MCDKPYTSSDKWTAALLAGLMFLLVSSPFTYTLTNGLAQSVLGVTLANDGRPNAIGLIVHGAVFMVLLRLILNKSNSSCEKPYTSKDRWIVAIIGALMFILISSPFLYEAVNGLTSSVARWTIADARGRPNLGGLVLHTALFVGATRVLMR